MKKLFLVMLSMLLFLGNITPMSAVVMAEKSIYVMMSGNAISESTPLTFYFGTTDSVHPWHENTYKEAMVIETDYLGNPLVVGQPAIVKVTFPSEYSYVGYEGGVYLRQGVEVIDGGVYSCLPSFKLVDYTLEDLDDITLMDASNMTNDTVIPEGTKAYIFGSVYESIVNKGTILYADCTYSIVNEGTILDGDYGSIRNTGTILGGTYGATTNEGTIHGGTFTYFVKNTGTILDGDFSKPSSVIYLIDGTVSDNVKEKCKVITSQPVTFNLDKITYGDDTTFTTTPGEWYYVELYADEGYVLPEEISIKINGEAIDEDNYDYYFDSAVVAQLSINAQAITGPIEITSSAVCLEEALVKELSLGNTYIVREGYVRTTSGENWSYDSLSNTLTLDNLNLISDENNKAHLYCSGDLNIVVKGTNTIDQSHNEEKSSAIYVEGNLDISGTSEDSLIVCASINALYTYNDIVISGCNLEAKATAEYSYAEVIYSFESITIKDGAVVLAYILNETSASGKLIVADDGDLTIDSATVSVMCGENAQECYGLYANDKIILNNAVVNATGNPYDIFMKEISYDENSIMNFKTAHYNFKNLLWDEASRTFVCSGHTGGELICSGYQCENCLAYYGEGDGVTHIGGTADCSHLKVCEACGTSYGEFALNVHKWVNGVCEDCETQCTHEGYLGVGVCRLCGLFVGEEIHPDNTYTVAGDKLFKFVPKATNGFIIRSESSCDPTIVIYDENYRTLKSENDSNYREENKKDFRVEYTFEQGKTYYFQLYEYTQESDFFMIFECKEHLVEDATCQHASICRACEKEFAPIDTNNHGEYLVQVDPQEATYEDAGWEAYEYCSKCSYTTYKEIPMKNMSAVKNLVVKATDYKTATLTWDAVEGATVYDVYRQSYTEGALFELVQSVDTNTASITGLKTGKTYSFYVMAKNNKFSTEASETVSVATALEGEVKLEIEQVSASKFKLSWNKIDGATRYIVYRKRNDDKLKKVLTLGADKLEYTTAEMPNGEYQFVLKAGRYDSIDRVMTKASNTVIGSVAKVKPSVKLTAGTKQVKVSWEKLEGVTNYEVYRATSGKYTKIKTTTATSYTAKSLTKGKKYYFKVRGYKLYKSGDDIKYNVYTDYSSAKGATAK